MEDRPAFWFIEPDEVEVSKLMNYLKRKCNGNRIRDCGKSFLFTNLFIHIGSLRGYY